MHGIKLKSIKGLLLAYVTLITAVVLTALFMIGYHRVKETRSAVEKELSSILRLQASFLNSWFDTTSENLAGLSMLTSVGRNDNVSMLRDFQGVVESNRSFESVAYADANGNIILDTSFGIRKSPFVTIADRLYYLEAKEHRSHVSGVIASRVSGRPVVVFSHPVIRRGEFDGLVFFTVRFDTMVKLVETAAYGETGRFYIVDRTGSAFESGNTDTKRRFTEEQLEMLADEGLHRYKGSMDETVLGSAIPISKRNFLIIAEIEEGERIKPFAENGFVLLMSSASVLLAAILLSMGSYGGVKQSIRGIRDGIAGIQKGTYSKIDAARLSGFPGEFLDMAVELNSMIETVKKRSDELTFQGFHDATTTLYNRQYFQEEAKRVSTGRFDPVGVFICDVNGLKLVNDTLGHLAGDNLLREAASAIQGCFRKGDFVARIGGDEFAILIPKATREVMEAAAERLVRASKEGKSEPGSMPVSFAFGYAWGDTKMRPLAEMVAEADDAMYIMKDKQRDCYRSDLVEYLMKELSNHQNLRQGHMLNCERIMRDFAEFCRYPDDYADKLVLLARYHDIGFVGIPLSIANKKDRLSPDEFREVRRHPEIGYRIAQVVPELRSVAEFIRVHHFWYNGEGYPPAAGERGIPREARIMKIVDAFVAMTMDKTYRTILTREEALAELRRCSGREFDPEIVEEFGRFLASCGPSLEP